MSKHIDDGMAALRAFSAYEKGRRQHECEELIKVVQQVPISAEVLSRLAHLNPGDFARVMRSHPGRKDERQLRSLWAMFETFRAACDALQASIARLGLQFTSKTGVNTDKQTDLVVTMVRKDIFAVSSAAAALVNHARRIKQLIPDVEYESRRKAVFEEGEHQFVIELRRNLAHVIFLEGGCDLTGSFCTS